MNLTQAHITQVQTAVDKLGLQGSPQFKDLCNQWLLFCNTWLVNFEQRLEEYIEWLSWRILIQQVLDQLDDDLADMIAQLIYEQDC
tara:strand:- start:429 stop:686 length:258 start_codon:yes stop_codon:yes gene_type:complete